MKNLTLKECQTIYGGDSTTYLFGYYLGKARNGLIKFYDAFLKPDHNMGIPFAA